MKFLKNKKAQQGFTLVEIMVATAVLGAIIYSFTGSSRYIDRSVKKTENDIVIRRGVLDLYESIRSTGATFQVTTDPTTFKQMTSKDTLMKELPLAWNEDGIIDASYCVQKAASGNCDHYKGRMGFIIEPHPNPKFRGVYKLTIRVVHKDLIENFEDYEFIINGI